MMSTTISKQSHNDNPNSFEHLYQLGLTYIQQLSGQIWTDYNPHDPGMTILEQVCYAITDLIYRCEFSVTDYLCDERGNIDYPAHGLALAQEILPAYPQQLADYEHWLLNKLPQLDNVWLRWNANTPSLGIYTINAQLNHFYALSQPNKTATNGIPDKRQSAINDIYREFHQVRALGEDLAAVQLTGQHPLTLHATFYINDEITNVTELVANIYHQVKLWLETTTKTTTADVIKETLLAEESIQRIDAFQFIQYSDDAGQDTPAYITEIAPFSYLKLPDSSASLGIEIIQHQHPIEIDYSDLTIQIEQLQHQRRASQVTSTSLAALPKGHYVDFSQYESIQTLFPRNYHLAPGTPNRYDAQQQGQRYQLRGYLLLFDQFMANFCQDIEALDSLFSLSLEPQATYHQHVLQPDEFYNIDQHYPKEATTRLEQLRARFDNYPERKNRLFDYLLGLYSERFPDELHRQFNPYFSAQELERQLLKYKQAFLLNITTMTNQRSLGDNLFNADHQGGYRQRLALLLGLYPHSTPTVTNNQSLIEAALNIMPSDTYYQSDIGKDMVILLPEDMTAYLQPLTDNIVEENISSSQRAYLRETLPLLSAQTLPEELLQYGIDNRRYRLLYDEQENDYQLLFCIDHHSSQEWLYIAHDESAEQLTQLCHQLQNWLIELNQISEGLYVVEPILLRTQQDTARLSTYANRITIVMPSYTARFSQHKFREQAEQLIIANSPAHLLIQCQWLEFYAFSQFETLYSLWRDAKASALQHQEQQPDCDLIAQELLHFLHKCHAHGVGESDR
ncbi:hypothetical protein F9817_06855 [Vibrio sp. CAIM 722]|uniref:Uncharacterized protein n=1 Tax=Vibrio eleionomae TaxID=2653505 RepID=A0A7X4LJ65_9VIBR|nr:hypothetical protein [Vibrio eleionomae]MZI92914.1 hypothetical protein [Vibrio eleionomae]